MQIERTQAKLTEVKLDVVLLTLALGEVLVLARFPGVISTAGLCEEGCLLVLALRARRSRRRERGFGRISTARGGFGGCCGSGGTPSHTHQIQTVYSPLVTVQPLALQLLLVHPDCVDLHVSLGGFQFHHIEFLNPQNQLVVRSFTRPGLIFVRAGQTIGFAFNQLGLFSTLVYLNLDLLERQLPALLVLIVLTPQIRSLYVLLEHHLLSLGVSRLNLLCIFQQRRSVVSLHGMKLAVHLLLLLHVSDFPQPDFALHLILQAYHLIL